MDAAVVFDMDGVITDSEPFMDRHRIGFLKELGVTKVDESFLHSLRGMTGKKEWETYKERFSLPQPLEELTRGFRKRYLAELDTASDIILIPGVRDLIDMLRGAGVPLALASSSSAEKIQTLLRRFKLDASFEAVVSGHEVEHSKPAPDIYLLAAARLKQKPHNCIAIEDAQNGIESAKSAKMKVIAYLPVGSRQDVSRADLVVTHFNELTFGSVSRLFTQAS